MYPSVAKDDLVRPLFCKSETVWYGLVYEDNLCLLDRCLNLGSVALFHAHIVSLLQEQDIGGHLRVKCESA